MPMNNRLFVPRQTTHPEALAWRTAVIANGGSVSGTTLTAVDRFVKSIYAAGIRDRFYRLNLFCGTGLSAALVPLFRGPVYGGATYGNSTDTNNNFVSGNYNETGSSCGLQADGISKYLGTGYPGNTLAQSNAHLGVGLRSANSLSGYRCGIGCAASAPNEWSIYFLRSSETNPNCQFSEYASGAASKFGDAGNAQMAVGNLVATWPNLYRDGAVTGSTGTTPTSYGASSQVGVFATGAGANPVNSRMDWYSIGAVMTGAQVVSFNAAIVAFQAALSRS